MKPGVIQEKTCNLIAPEILKLFRKIEAKFFERNGRIHHTTNDFLNSLASNSFIPYILHPTRITSHSKTLTDNIFSNYISHEIVSGNITATRSDHLPQFLFVPNILSNSSTQKSNFYERDWSKFKQEDFNWTI